MEVWGKSILGEGTAKISVHPEQVSHRSYVVGAEYAGPHRHLKCFGSYSEWDREPFGGFGAEKRDITRLASVCGPHRRQGGGEGAARKTVRGLFQ